MQLSTISWQNPLDNIWIQMHEHERTVMTNCIIKSNIPYIINLETARTMKQRIFTSDCYKQSGSKAAIPSSTAVSACQVFTNKNTISLQISLPVSWILLFVGSPRNKGLSLAPTIQAVKEEVQRHYEERHCPREVQSESVP